MARGFQASWIIGKTVAGVEMNPFDNGRGGIAHDPVIRFTDGSFITFDTQETETGTYGTAVIYGPPARRKR